MKISEQWLREWVNPELSAGELAEQLTLAGLEVESVAPVVLDCRGVVCGRVQKLDPHPRSDRLRLCRVDAGQFGIMDVICGAPSIELNANYALATPGARLAGGRVLAATEIQGVHSAGMLCSGAELGLSDDAGTLFRLDADAEPGATLDSLLGDGDTVLDLAVTPNRGDCLSIAGIAREVAVLNQLTCAVPPQEKVAVQEKTRREVHLEAPKACPRYAGRVITGVDASRPTPLWMAERLRRCGLRPISVVVDITNYVMLELGQPMHAFDDERLHGDIRVRMAREGEGIRLLDDSDHKLAADTLVIADDSGPVALAGIMGGAGSAVSDTTRRIFLESAFFAPDAVRGRARRHGLATDASYRFERGVDFTLQQRALERASGLIRQLCGGNAGPVVDARMPDALPASAVIDLREARLTRVLGTSIEASRAGAILESLGLGVKRSPGGWRVTVAPHRFDLSLEADLIEEVARIHGYGRIPGTHVRGSLAMRRTGGDPRFPLWRRILADRGYFEAITYSFVSSAMQAQLLGEVGAVKLINPISADMDVMRTSLWPGLLQALKFNLNRQQERVRLFEIGRVFGTGPSPRQEFRLAGIVHGNINEEQWDIVNRSSDFYDLKGDVQALLTGLAPGRDLRWKPARRAGLHPGRTADIYLGEVRVGCLGALDPVAAAPLDLPSDVFLFELEIQALPTDIPRKFKEISRFPSVRRDMALLVDADLSAAAVLECARAAGGPLLINLQLFDVYDGEGIDLGKKSLAMGLTFQKTSSTLIEEEVDSALAGILDRLREELGAKLRE